MTTGPRLFSLFPPAFAAVPQYLVHISVELLSLTEPDKRLSHTSGSSVRYSVNLRSTTRVQVFADSWFGPPHPGQSLIEVFPGVCPALALAVEPFEQNSFSAVDIVAAPFQVVRYGVIAQMPNHSGSGLPEHLSLSHYVSGFLRPVRELAQTLDQLLTAGATFDFEVPFFRFPAVMREPQKGELLWFLAALVRVLTGITPKFDTVGLFLRQLQTESFESVRKTTLKTLRILFVLETGQKSSQPREPPPELLTEPDVNLSAHPAPIVQPMDASPTSSEQTLLVLVAQYALTSALPAVCDLAASCISLSPNGLMCDSDV